MNETLKLFQKLAIVAADRGISFELEYTPDPDEWQIHLIFPVRYKDSAYLTDMHRFLHVALKRAIAKITTNEIKDDRVSED